MKKAICGRIRWHFRRYLRFTRNDSSHYIWRFTYTVTWMGRRVVMLGQSGTGGGSNWIYNTVFLKSDNIKQMWQNVGTCQLWVLGMRVLVLFLILHNQKDICQKNGVIISHFPPEACQFNTHSFIRFNMPSRSSVFVSASSLLLCSH